MKTYKVKLVLEEVEVADTHYGIRFAEDANNEIKCLQPHIENINHLVDKAIRHTEKIKSEPTDVNGIIRKQIQNNQL